MMTGKNSSVPIAKPKSSEQERAVSEAVSMESQVTGMDVCVVHGRIIMWVIYVCEC